jgi:MscS family membrane protein
MSVLASAPVRPFLERHAPPSLLEAGPWGLAWWQVLAAPALLLLSLALGWALALASRRLLVRLSAAGTGQARQAVSGLFAPLFLFWSAVAAGLLRRSLDLPEEALSDVRDGLRAAVTVALFWAALRSVDAALAWAAESPWGRTHVQGAAMLPSLRRATKVAVVALGAVAVMAQVGYPVGSLLAGLGLGGLAVALAAQKTVENLIGSVTIGLDVPFKVGDWVRVEGAEGTVEAVGLRSTRLRTLDRTVVTIPNGKLADGRVESFGPRDRIRLQCSLALRYGTTAAQLRQVLAGVEAALRSHPRIWRDDLRVRLTALGAWSMDVEVMAWLQTADWAEFLAARQELLLAFVEVVEGAGAAFAFPTQTVELARPERGGPGR